MSETPKIVFVTKYALTEGVREAEVVSLRLGDYAYVRTKGASSYGMQMGKADWHTTREAAVARANAMRDAKLASLDKQAERLRKLTF